MFASRDPEPGVLSGAQPGPVKVGSSVIYFFTRSIGISIEIEKSRNGLILKSRSTTAQATNLEISRLEFFRTVHVVCVNKGRRKGSAKREASLENLC